MAQKHSLVLDDPNALAGVRWPRSTRWCRMTQMHSPVPDGPEALADALVNARVGPDALVNARDGPDALVNIRDGPDALVNSRDGPDALVNARDGPDALVNVRDGPYALVNARDGLDNGNLNGYSAPTDNFGNPISPIISVKPAFSSITLSSPPD
ncbi:uncharacterized protein LOC124946237 [Impatiens glandulifera]|uniref:uncharacterized protein LOC124946237 n=1 Tax=Impatiens glandulifera TaxID=253017 RepID=UPI001FB17C3B|nr:uncharacterized protein LOC124946237 [Impatiens glandulifera]